MSYHSLAICLLILSTWKLSKVGNWMLLSILLLSNDGIKAGLDEPTISYHLVCLHVDCSNYVNSYLFTNFQKNSV